MGRKKKKNRGPDLRGYASVSVASKVKTVKQVRYFIEFVLFVFSFLEMMWSLPVCPFKSRNSSLVSSDYPHILSILTR